MVKQLTVLVKEPNQEPRITMVGNDLASMNKLVGCAQIEVIRLPYPCSSVIMVCDKEGKQNGREANFCLGCDVIVGTVFFCRTGIDGSYVSISYDTAQDVKALMMLGKLEG